jgi:hypothetical protein
MDPNSLWVHRFHFSVPAILKEWTVGYYLLSLSSFPVAYMYFTRNCECISSESECISVRVAVNRRLYRDMFGPCTCHLCTRPGGARHQPH